jgi:release factor glutamine methyltransferase
MNHDLGALRHEIASALSQLRAEDGEFDQDAIPVDVNEEAQVIVAEAMKRSPADPHACALEFLARRQAGELLGHVLGKVSFLGCELLTASDCLVPRRETETLGHAAIELLKSASVDSPRCIDMCCGAGNLACAIAYHVPKAHVWASDLTEGCVRLARANVSHLGLGERVDVFQGNLFSALEGMGLQGTVDLVVCNPPYISTARLGNERARLLAREPREAFDGGPYGLSIHQLVLKEAPAYLRPGGWVGFEIGVGQQRQLELLIQRSLGVYGPARWECDNSSRPRAALLQRM